MNAQRYLLLDAIRRVRDGNESHRHAPFARHQLRILESDFYALIKAFPALGSTDPAQLTAAWDAFERSDASLPYRVGAIHRGIIKNGVIGI